MKNEDIDKCDLMVCGSEGKCSVDRSKTIALGRNLLKKMKGKGWRLRVWENIGWHYCVINGPVQVYPLSSSHTEYHCLVSSNSVSRGGCGIWTSPKNISFDDPNTAVRTEVENAKRVVTQLVNAVKEAEKAVVKGKG
jgi:hypothetical protein